MPLPHSQKLTGPDSHEVEQLTSKYVLARRGFRKLEAIGCAERILAIYEKNGVDIPALQAYRDFLAENGGNEWRNAT